MACALAGGAVLLWNTAVFAAEEQEFRMDELCGDGQPHAGEKDGNRRQCNRGYACGN